MVRRESIHIKFDTDEPDLSESYISITETQFNKIIDTFRQLGIKVVEKRDPGYDCPGGTEIGLRIWDINGSLILEGNSRGCGDEEIGTLRGDIEILGNVIESMIPEFSSMPNLDREPKGENE